MDRKLRPFVLFLILASGGCASMGQIDKIDETSETNQKLMRETEHRISSLEKSVSALNGQIANLNNRVYEVRTNSGKKTSMKVVPVIADSSQAVGTGVSNREIQVRKSADQPATPQRAKIIDPAAKPAPLAAQNQKSKPVAASSTPKNYAGPAGSLGAGARGSSPAAPQEAPVAEGLDLPPTELDSTVEVPKIAETLPSASGSSVIAPVQSSNVPVPPIGDSAMDLPPEQAREGHADNVQSGNAPAQAASLPAAQTGQSNNPRGEEAAYKAALNLVLSGKTGQGISSFRQFLQQYPSGKYAANANFWIGECLYSQGKYQEALNQFQIVNNSFPSHHKNADALLKAGMALSRLGNREGAAEKFRAVLSSFPNSDAAKRARSLVR